jgi:hypothetical protein
VFERPTITLARESLKDEFILLDRRALVCDDSDEIKSLSVLEGALASRINLISKAVLNTHLHKLRSH